MTYGEYLKLYYSTYKRDQQANTTANRERIVRNHILPVFGNREISEITTIELQRFFNEKGKSYALATSAKIKNIMSPVFDSAVEDELIMRNPLHSKRLILSGRECVPHKAIPADRFSAVKAGLMDLPWRERGIGGLLCYTGMRFEEVLGFKWGDIEGDWLHIQRAVVHPDRNQPEVKCPKTRTSNRKVPIHPQLQMILDSYDGERIGFLLFQKKPDEPLTYTEARYALLKIRQRFDILPYSAHDFRDSCATTWRENGMPLDMIARLLGHSKTEVTEKRYVKYRDEFLIGAIEMM